MVNILLFIFSLFKYFSMTASTSDTTMHCHSKNDHVEHDFHSHGDHSMAMYFNWKTTEYFFIKQWYTSSTSAYMASLLAIFLLCIGNEYLRKLRGTYEDQSAPLATSEKKTDDSTGAKFNQTLIKRRGRSLTKRFMLAFIQNFLSYSIMLSTMTFNSGVVISVCLGLSAGSLLFPFKRSANDKDHCC